MKPKKKPDTISVLQHRILSLLIKERTGPELLTELEKQLGEGANMASYYSALRTMEKKSGWIEAGPAGGDDARVRRYKLTAEGKRAYSANRDVIDELGSLGAEGATV